MHWDVAAVVLGMVLGFGFCYGVANFLLWYWA